MIMKKNLSAILVIVLFISVHFSCTGVQNALENAQRLQFKLGKVNGFSLAGVNLQNISSINSFSLLDAASLLAAFTSGTMPATFNVNLIAKNPNTAGGSTESSQILKSLDWRLLIDDKDIIGGAITTPVTIPGKGQQTTIAIPISVDLLQFFGNGGYNNLINLALAIGGKSGNSSRLTLKIRPTVSTFLGDITYPGEINVIDKEFR